MHQLHGTPATRCWSAGATHGCAVPLCPTHSQAASQKLGRARCSCAPVTAACFCTAGSGGVLAEAPTCSRRAAVLSVAHAFMMSNMIKTQGAVSAEQPVLVVDARSSEGYTTISGALAAATPGSIIMVAAGRYQERLIIDKAVTIQGTPKGSMVEVIWRTETPYESVVQCSSGGAAVLEGLTLRHYSKSVANNYGVFAQEGELTLLNCDISSSSGSGVGIEGAAVTLQGCTIHDCQSHGVAIFGSLDGTHAGTCSVSKCTIANNKLNGVLVRDGAAPVLDSNDITGNGECGLLLKDCGGRYSSNRVSRNRKGSIGLDASNTELDVSVLESDNSLDQPVALL